MRLQKREAWIPLAVVLCPGPAACGFTTQHTVGFSTFSWTRIGKLSSRAGGGKATWGGKILVCRNWKLIRKKEMMSLMVSKGLRLLERGVY